MTAHRLINIALTAALTAAIATILSTGHLLDDHSAEWNHSTAQRAAHHVTGCAIASVERMEGGAA